MRRTGFLSLNHHYFTCVTLGKSHTYALICSEGVILGGLYGPHVDLRESTISVPQNEHTFKECNIDDFFLTNNLNQKFSMKRNIFVVINNNKI